MGLDHTGGGEGGVGPRSYDSKKAWNSSISLFHEVDCLLISEQHRQDTNNKSATKLGIDKVQDITVSVLDKDRRNRQTVSKTDRAKWVNELNEEVPGGRRDPLLYRRGDHDYSPVKGK